ncbi:MAG: SDR family oxidoreductase [Myxococcota bacterium]
MTTTDTPEPDAGEPDATPSITPEEWRTCLRVLSAVVADRAHLAGVPAEERKELVMLAGRVARPERHEVVRLTKALRRADRKAQRDADLAALSQSGLRVQRKAPVYTPLWLTPPEEAPEQRAGPELGQERHCYVCKQPFRKVHFFYDAMCAECGDFNYAKRSQTADLTGRVALITGARVKIGYQAALMVLRAGATVVATTRFPQDAAERFSREPDFPSWQGRLHIHGLDLRHSPAVELLARHLCQTLPRLDIIINNACQTVRRPPAFYAHLLERESLAPGALPGEQRRLLDSHEELKRTLRSQAAAPTTEVARQLMPVTAGAPGVGVWGSAMLSQVRFLDEDFIPGRELFPRHRYDEDLQQVDLREVNSWRLTLSEVSTPELLEVHLVNAVAPFVLNSKLKPLMLRTPGRDKHVVNVSAMEGQFYRAAKTDRHPHTNMAKAALNMMTRTSAPDYVKDGIHMNSVDTGWVTDEDPAVHAARKAELGFQPPLDIVDGAARICDPFFHGLNTGQHAWGQFFKDYKPAPW